MCVGTEEEWWEAIQALGVDVGTEIVDVPNQEVGQSGNQVQDLKETGMCGLIGVKQEVKISNCCRDMQVVCDTFKMT